MGTVGRVVLFYIYLLLGIAYSSDKQTISKFSGIKKWKMRR